MTVAPFSCHCWAWWISPTSIARSHPGYLQVRSLVSTALACVAENVRCAFDASSGSPYAVSTIRLRAESQSKVANWEGARGVPSSSSAGSKPLSISDVTPARIRDTTRPSCSVTSSRESRHSPRRPRPWPLRWQEGGDPPRGSLELRGGRTSGCPPAGWSRELPPPPSRCRQPFSIAFSVCTSVDSGT